LKYSALMKLQRYLEVYKITQKEAAEAMGVHPKYLGAVINGQRPGRALVEKIAAFTDGEVRSDDLPGWENFR